MRVAVVQTEVGRETGGRFSFQNAVLDGLDRVAAGTSHEFMQYSEGWTRTTPGSPLAIARRAGLYLLTRFTRVFRDAQDSVLGVRPLHVRTPFERRLDRDGIDLVWFLDPYADDCHLPYIFTVFDLEYLRQPWFPELTRRGEFERRHLHYNRHMHRATRVIVPNEAGVDQVTTLFGIPPERVIALGHPTPAFAQEAPGPQSRLISADQDPRSPYLFYPAALWPHKNHYNALRALRAANAVAEEPFDLVCVGADKGHLELVRTWARELGVEDRVHFRGFVELPELIGLYQNAHALLYMSFLGPENLPPLEAFALGCPVITADIPGAREQLGSAALYTSPTDPVRASELILELRDDELRRRLVEAGRRRAREASAERYLSGVVEFLDEFEHVLRCWTSERARGSAT